MKIIYFAGLSIAIIFSVNFLLNWENPKPNLNKAEQETVAWLDLITKHKNHKHIVLKFMNHDFDVYYVKNMDLDSKNPYFPGIHIIANNECNAWLHVVRTDFKWESEWREFIDTWPEGYPFYTKDKNFLDVPFWNYKIFSKALSYWIGHAYGVHVDEQEKTIKCFGGISWGYRLPWWSLRPIMIEPTVLTESDWQRDWIIFQKALVGYTLTQ